MEICKTDIGRILKYLDDSAALYDRCATLSARRRAWSIRQLTEKIRRKQGKNITTTKSTVKQCQTGSK